MLSTRIESVGCYHPPHVVEPSQIIEEAGLTKILPSSYITDLTGIKTMHHGDREARPSDFAVLAAEDALAKFSGDVSEIDCVIFCGMNRDMQEPSTAHIIANRLGINPLFCPDISDACHGLTAGLILADQLTKSGSFRNVLVCTGETPSHGTAHIANRFKKGELVQDDVEDNIGAFTVGDAGGAFIVGPTDDGTGLQPLTLSPGSAADSRLSFHTNGKSEVWSACFVDWDKNAFAMHMQWISRETIRMVARMAPKTLSAGGWETEDIDMFIAHQVGRRVHEAYLKALKLPEERTIETYPDYGNVTSATLALCWDILQDLERLPAGSRVFFNSTGSGIIVSQFLYLV